MSALKLYILEASLCLWCSFVSYSEMRQCVCFGWGRSRGTGLFIALVSCSSCCPPFSAAQFLCCAVLPRVELVYSWMTTWPTALPDGGFDVPTLCLTGISESLKPLDRHLCVLVSSKWGLFTFNLFIVNVLACHESVLRICCHPDPHFYTDCFCIEGGLPIVFWYSSLIY